MRSDSLAQLLSNASVTAHSQVLVVDDALGLVVGAVTERMGGYGRVLHGYVGHVSKELTRKFNFGDSTRRSICDFPLNTISSLSLDEEDIIKREEAYMKSLEPEILERKREREKDMTEAQKTKDQERMSAKEVLKQEKNKVQGTAPVRKAITIRDCPIIVLK